MFLLRSAFWLTAAFLVMRPTGDIGASTAELRDTAMAAGRQLVMETVTDAVTETLLCTGPQSVIAWGGDLMCPKTQPDREPAGSLADAPLPMPRLHRDG